MSAELIERYVQEVSRRLHESQREDVSRELRSSIYDEVEHRFGPEPTDEEVVAYLRELDPPEQAAAGYRPELLYLVGPAWFPAFRTVVKIVLPIQIGLILLGFVIRTFTDTGFGNFGGEIFGFLGAVVDASVYSFGMIVLIFFGLERLEMRRPAKQRRSAKVWEPRSLPDSRPHDRVGYANAVTSIVVSIVFLALLHVFASDVGIRTGADGPPLLNDVYQRHLPWISASILISIAYWTVLLIQGRWTWITRFARLASDGFGLWVFYRVVTDVVAHRPALVGAGIEGPVISIIERSLWLSFAVAVAIVVVTNGVRFYRALTGRRQVADGVGPVDGAPVTMTGSDS